MPIALYGGMTAAVYEVRGTVDKPDVSDVVRLVKAEYLEMPGLCLTPAQVQRLWDLDRETSTAVLKELVKDGFLCVSEAGTFGRRDSGERLPLGGARRG